MTMPTPTLAPSAAVHAAGGPPAGELPSRLRFTITRLARRLRQQGDSELTPSMLSALASVASRGPLALGDLAALEGIAPPSLTRIVGRLEEEGLVQRVVDHSDRRVANVSVSAEGRDLLARARSRKDAYLAARIAALGPAEQARLEAAVPVLERLLSMAEGAP